MKFLASLALVAAVGVSAQDQTSASMPAQDTAAAAAGGDTDCLANYIVTRCLQTEQVKVSDCAANDWDCLCAAYQAVATCYNNCPNDSRAPAARAQVGPACSNASLYSTAAQHSKTASAASIGSAATSASNTDLVNTAEVTGSGNAAPNTMFTASAPTKTAGAESLSGNAGGMLLAVAAGVAAVL